MRANLGPGLQLPIVESRAGLAPPVALALTERYRYRDGGPGGPGRRWVRFEPVAAEPLLFSGRLLVQEETGRVLEEHSERSGLPGIVKSERRVLTYGEAGGGSWRVVKAEMMERWLLGGRPTQVRRRMAYSDFRTDEPQFEADRQAARASDGTMMRQTLEGTRYLNKQKDGTRRVEEQPRSSGRGLGVLLLADPGLSPPVLPLAGLAYFNFNALGRGIQVNVLTALVYNYGQVTVPIGRGFDLSADSTSMFLTATERPIEHGRVQDQDGVGRRFATLNLALGHDLGGDFRLDGSLRFQQDSFAQAPEEQYRTPGYVLPPLGRHPGMAGPSVLAAVGFPAGRILWRGPAPGRHLRGAGRPAGGTRPGPLHPLGAVASATTIPWAPAPGCMGKPAGPGAPASTGSSPCPWAAWAGTCGSPACAPTASAPTAWTTPRREGSCRPPPGCA